MCKVITSKKKNKTVISSSNGTFKPIAELDSVISGVTRSIKVTTSLNKSYSAVTKAYNKK